jgi:hypothetical protein
MAMTSLPLFCSVAVLLVACGGGGAPSGATVSGPSGSLGVVTAGEAAEAVSALCDLRDATDRDQANAQFFDRAHQTLHVLAAATEVVDRVPAAGLLEAMQGVEGDLQADALPQTFAADVGGLLDATRRTLRTVDLPAPAC